MNTAAYYKERLTTVNEMPDRFRPTFAYDYFRLSRFGSELWVWAEKWEVRFSRRRLTGHSPMMKNWRFKDEFFTFDSKTFETHVMNLPECLDIYFSKKAQLPADINYSIVAKPGIKISCGKIADGISCFHDYYSFRTKDDLQKILDYFNYTKRKAEEKMAVLKEII